MSSSSSPSELPLALRPPWRSAPAGSPESRPTEESLLPAAPPSDRKRSRPVNRVLILGTHVLATQVAEAMAADGNRRFHLLGVVDDSTENGLLRPGTPILGSLHQFSEIVAATRPTHIVIAMADRRGRLPAGPLLEARLNNVVVETAADFFERLSGKLAIEALHPSSLIMSNAFRHVDLGAPWLRSSVRRGISLLCAVIGLALAAPLLALISVAIKLDSHGGVFFVHERIGRRGQRFGLIKFRTMKTRTGGPASEWVSDNADRITRVGRWLRRFRIDELPQLINVIRGEMNIVGPRPHPVSNYQLFLENIPYYAVRAMVRPGITGWAQVRYGYANDLTEETEKMRYDLYYIKHANFLLDVRIIAETILLLIFDRRSHCSTRKRLSGSGPAEVSAI